MDKFTFIVIAYNHQDYIIEHLESIKYQIKNFGTGININLIVADDGSVDKTVELTKFWLQDNSDLFSDIKIVTDGINRGTCKNLTLALKFLETEFCKLTAGDDVYSCENLFIEFEKICDVDILSGLPVIFVDGKMTNSSFEIFNLCASSVIYKNLNYKERLKKISFSNAPSTVYKVDALKNDIILQFINSFTVTEDFPLHIKMAELYSPLKFEQIDKIFVYYRRTANSTYIIKNTIFDKDKVEIFNYLISKEKKIFNKFLLKNRLFCFNIPHKYLKRLFNINVYIYGFRIIFNFMKIYKKFKSISIDYDKYQKHYNLIVGNSMHYIQKFEQKNL